MEPVKLYSVALLGRVDKKNNYTKLVLQGKLTPEEQRYAGKYPDGKYKPFYGHKFEFSKAVAGEATRRQLLESPINQGSTVLVSLNDTGKIVKIKVLEAGLGEPTIMMFEYSKDDDQSDASASTKDGEDSKASPFAA